MKRVILPLALATCLLGACAGAFSTGDQANVQQQVMERERAFARTMAERDHSAFTTFLSEEAIFFSGDEAIRGRAAVASAWRQATSASAHSRFQYSPEMKIGVPKEIKTNENRIALVPAGARARLAIAFRRRAARQLRDEQGLQRGDGAVLPGANGRGHLRAAHQQRDRAA